LDLLDKMLTLNPDSRITAKEAILHEYFTTAPLPCTASEMPKIQKEYHDFVIKAERKAHQLQQQQQNNLNQMNNAMKANVIKYGNQQNIVNKFPGAFNPNYQGGNRGQNPQNMVSVGGGRSQNMNQGNYQDHQYANKTMVQQSYVNTVNPNQPNSTYPNKSSNYQNKQTNHTYNSNLKPQKNLHDSHPSKNISNNNSNQKDDGSKKKTSNGDLICSLLGIENTEQIPRMESRNPVSSLVSLITQEKTDNSTSLNVKRKQSHDISEFEKITKKKDG